jgi:hypothetical protein
VETSERIKRRLAREWLVLVGLFSTWIVVGMSFEVFALGVWPFNWGPIPDIDMSRALGGVLGIYLVLLAPIRLTMLAVKVMFRNDERADPSAGEDQRKPADRSPEQKAGAF